MLIGFLISTQLLYLNSYTDTSCTNFRFMYNIHTNYSDERNVLHSTKKIPFDRQTWTLNRAVIPTGEINTDKVPVGWTLLPAASNLPLLNDSDVIETEFSQKEFKKGRPCGGLPSKPSCVMLHRMTHHFSSYYKS